MSDPVTYTAVLPVAEETVQFVSTLLAADQRRRRTRPKRRALGCYRQALLILRWFLDGTRLAQLAADNDIGRWTAYRYLHEGIDVLADRAPGLRGALLAARAAGHPHVTVDGTLIRTDRCHVPGPTARTDRSGRSGRQVDLWWSGKHAAHGGNVQVIAAPDGWPLWTSAVRPGREHDTTALRTHPEALPLLVEWTDAAHAALADLGYEGERDALTTPIKHSTERRLTADERCVNLLHAAVRAPPNAATPVPKVGFGRVGLRFLRQRPHQAVGGGSPVNYVDPLGTYSFSLSVDGCYVVCLSVGVNVDDSGNTGLTLATGLGSPGIGGGLTFGNGGVDSGPTGSIGCSAGAYTASVGTGGQVAVGAGTYASTPTCMGLVGYTFA